MSFYSEMADMATELLTEFGQTVTIKRTTGESRDPVTYVITPGTTTEYTPVGVIKKYSDKVIDGTRIQVSDRMLVLDDTLEPLQGDLVTVDGEDWNIVEFEKKDPAGTPIVYICQVRR